MLGFTEKEIVEICGGSRTYFKGKQYYNSSKVGNLEFDLENNQLTAIVLGTKRYKVGIHLDGNGEFHNAFCTCPAYHQYVGYCKHIAAVLIAISHNKKSIYELLKRKKGKYIQDIIDYFRYDVVQPKIPLNLEINYEFEKDSYYGYDYSSKIFFRLGEEKLYILKSPKKFIHTIQRNEPMEFGKQFTFFPERHFFQKEDQSFIDLMKEVVEQEELLNFSSWGFEKYSIFHGKYMILSPAMVKRFFEMVKRENRALNVTIGGITYEDVYVLREDLPIEFKLTTKDSNDILLEIKKDKKLQALTEDGAYFFYDKNIYALSKEQQKTFLPFYHIMEKEDQSTLSIPKEYHENFVSQVLPRVEKIGDLTIDEKLQRTIYKPELKSEIFLDKMGEDVTAQIKYLYGDITIHPFQEDHKNLEDHRILVRDIEKENQIIALIEKAEFKVSSEYIYLQGHEKIYRFLMEIIPKLQQYSEVYYSENFKNIRIYSPSSLSARVRLNENSNLLEFDFDIEGIDKEELLDVFKAIQEKKKYYRLKEGSFLPLDLEEVENFSSLVDYLNVSPKDLSQKNIQIPKYRALYLDEILKDSKIKNINRNIAFKQLVQNIKEPLDLDYEIPDDFQKILRDYQVAGFKWLKTLSNYGMGGILADDMGLGKTIQVLALLTSEKLEKGSKPSLVVAPTSLVYNWLSEVEKFAPQLKTLVVSGTKEERHQNIKELSDYDLIVTSYPLIRRDIDLYQEYEFRYCILDEAQHIKNSTSQNAISVKKIKEENCFALTGTPIENSLTELWSIFDFIMPGFLLSYGRFIKKYERPIVKENNQGALTQLKKQISPFILRRLKKDVLRELPEKIETIMTVDLTKEQKLVYLSYLNQIKGEIDREIKDKGFHKSHMKILAGLTRLRQICCHPELFLKNYKGKSGKLELLEEVIEESLQGGHRILLFSQFTTMLKMIRELLEHNHLKYFYLDGSTKTKERGNMVSKFNQGEKDLFLISLKAGGTGLNLTGADMVIHFDPWWNPAVEEQATDRAYRIGQENTVQVIKLITKGTIEDKIFHIQEKKKKMIDSVIQPGETMISKLSEQEIRSLFEI